MDFLKIVEAPKWFIEMRNQCDELVKEQEGMLGADLSKKFKGIAKKGLKPAEEMVETEKLMQEMTKKGKLPPLEEQKKIANVQHYCHLLADFSWAKFRYENKDNAFGIANKLDYDRESQTIKITE